MAAWIALLIAGVLVLGAAFAPRKLLRSRLRIPAWAVTGAGGFALGAGFAYALFWLNPGEPAGPKGKPPEQTEVAAQPQPSEREPVLLTHPLRPGAALPPFPTHWLNGPPPGDPGRGKSVLVLDVWDDT